MLIRVGFWVPSLIGIIFRQAGILIKMENGLLHLLRYHYHQGT